MVDPNPARGMPLALQRYWLAGKGAAKIRWGMPHDFNRCVRQLRKYFPKNPQGLCNILHQKALGAPPGKGHPGEHAMLAAASEMQDMGALWAGPLAPIGRPTGEPAKTRVFEPGSMGHRSLPLPLAYRKVNSGSHQGAVTVGRILGFTIGPDHEGQDWAWAWGDWLNEDIVPEVKEARYMVQQGVVGPSVDPGGRAIATINPENGYEHTIEYTVGGVTLVAIPAFASMRLFDLDEDGMWPDDDPDMMGDYEGFDSDDSADCGCGDGYVLRVGEADTYAVNPAGWRGLPLAPRDAVFDNDDAVKRITAWAQVNAQGADVDKLRRAFMWRDPRQPETATQAYRLPVGDIINGRLTLIYHAIYAAAALISGAHGGLPNVPDEDKNQLRNVITDIYKEMAAEFNDPSVRAPWDRPETQGKEFAMADSPVEPYGDVKYADPGYRDNKKRYPIDTEEHARAAWSYINKRKNAAFYTPEQLKTIKERIRAALKKFGVTVSEEAGEHAMDYAHLLNPPAAWFEDPEFDARTPLTVTDDGQVYGHLAAWGECHRDVTNRECVLAPHSKQGYDPFHLGAVQTDDGKLVKVGKIVMDTRHADIRHGYASAALHYDNTGDEVAVVRAGEDEHGVWVAGAVVPEVDQKKIAKLRRSPLSGDWRRVDGNLELTAALAVNVPAFPVYAMDGDERTALVAAGAVYPDPEAGTFSIDMDQIREHVRDQVQEQEAQEDRGWRLREILEQEEDLLQAKRAAMLAAIYAAETGDAPLPVQQDVADLASEAAMLDRQANAQFTIVQEPEGANSSGQEVEEPAPVQGEGQVPVSQASVPGQGAGY